MVLLKHFSDEESETQERLGNMADVTYLVNAGSGNCGLFSSDGHFVFYSITAFPSAGELRTLRGLSLNQTPPLFYFSI